MNAVSQKGEDMPDKAYDTVVVIGRFQPPHYSHLALLQHAAAHAGQQVIVGIGSTDQPRTPKNPFSFAERVELLKATLPDAIQDKFVFVALTDQPGDDLAWANAVRAIVQTKADGGKIALIGHIKDASSFYLKLFSEWEFIDFGYLNALNATDIRAHYFQPEASLQSLAASVPAPVLEFLQCFRATADYQALCDQHRSRPSPG